MAPNTLWSFNLKHSMMTLTDVHECKNYNMKDYIISYSKKLDIRIVFGILCAILITFFYPCNVRAQEIATDSNRNTFLEQFYSGDKIVYVTNDDGDDVTEFFIEKTREMYFEGNFSAIQEIIAEEEVEYGMTKQLARLRE